MMARLAYDDADFKEQDHPRDKGGKFTSGGGAGGGAAVKPASSYKVTNTVKAALKTGGFTKTATPTVIDGQELHTYLHPSGAKVIVHPPKEGQGYSSKWQALQPGKETGGVSPVLEGTPALMKLFNIAVEKAQATPEPVASAPPVVGTPPGSTLAEQVAKSAHTLMTDFGLTQKENPTDAHSFFSNGEFAGRAHVTIEQESAGK